MEFRNSSLPHGREAVLVRGNTEQPRRALILLHGRGGTAANILELTNDLDLPSDVLVLAPQAANHTWYPERFLVSQVENQPGLDSALERIEVIIESLQSQYDIERSQVALAGFSQGACLVAEYVKRHRARYLAVAIYSGGLIGDDSEVSADIPGSLLATPVYMGCDEEDFHIPKERVEATAAYLRVHEAVVTFRLYQGLGHTIHEEGLDFLRSVFNK